MKLVFRKFAGVLGPIDEAGEKFMESVKNNDIVTIDVKRPRNIKLHNKWWGLCAYMAENSSLFPTAEHVSKFMLRKLGYYTEIRGEKFEDSISFVKMDEDTFQTMYNKAMDLVCEMLPNVTNEHVRMVLAEFAGVGSMMGHRNG